jgi:CubicO group peptidase (beta-lactamase class C family)
MEVVTTVHPRPRPRPILIGVRRTLVASAAALLLVTAAGANAAAPSVDSGTTEVDGWATVAPSAAGFDAGRLARLAREAGRDGSTCFAVVRDGRLVGDWNWGVERTAPREVFSVTKSIASALVGIAVRDGDLALDDRVSTYVPEWRGTPSAAVTVRNLLSNDSGRFWSVRSDYTRLTRAADRTSYAVGLRQQYRPGTRWAYNNAAIQVLDRVISTATGTPTDQFAAERLFAPLGMTHTRLTRDPSGRSTNTFVSAQTTCLDLARFARLYLQRGEVGGARILDRAYVRASVGRPSTRLNAAYGYLWWLNRRGPLRTALDPLDSQGRPVEQHRGRLVPGAPADLFSAVGFAGQIAMVDPGSRTIVLRIGPASAGRDYGLHDAARVVTWAASR